MLKVKVGELLPGSVFKISDESDQFLLIEKDTACLMFYYDSHELSAAVNTSTGKMISIENSKNVIPIVIKRRNDIKSLKMYDSYEVYTEVDLYSLFKIDKRITDSTLDRIFRDISEEHPIIIRFYNQINQNRVFIVSQYRTPEHSTVYEVQRVPISEIAI